MLGKTVVVSLLVAFASARFGQENAVQNIIAAVQGGAPGAAPTLAGASISTLLAGANACAKLSLADRVFTELGKGADALNAAKALVNAEKNVNPFAQSQPTLCSDATLPANVELRGITPKIDPAFDPKGTANALAASSLAKPLAAGGKSVADLLKGGGFTDLIAQAAAKRRRSHVRDFSRK